MRRYSICLSLILLGCVVLSAAAHADGRAYLYDADGRIVRNSNGECMRTASWTTDARLECDSGATIRPGAIFSIWPAPYKAAIPKQAAASAPAAPGIVDSVMENIESHIPPREELVPSRDSAAASQIDGTSKLPEGGAAAQPDAVSAAPGTGRVAAEAIPVPIPSSESAAAPSGTAAIPQPATGEELIPEWMKESAKEKPVPKAKRKPSTPIQVLIVIIFDILAVVTKFAHVW
jgi:hypothetical protein